MTLERLIIQYQPTQQTIDLVRSSRLVLFSGISGAGKDTVKRALMARNPIFHDIVSHTTRQPRHNNSTLEQDGIDYHFIDQATAQAMLEQEAFVEAKFVIKK